MRLLVVLFLSLCVVAPAWAEGFAQIRDRKDFVSLIQGRELTRLGVNLDVLPDGRIRGRAFGRNVTGAWYWQSGYFCRDLSWGRRDFGMNCQSVKVQGQTVRFIADKGQGDHADMTLR